MRKLIVCVSLLLLVTVSLQAQFLKVGPKLGANMVKMDGKSFKDEFQLGYFAGLFAELNLGKKFYLQPEVLWAENKLSTSSEFSSIYEDLLVLDTLKDIKLQSMLIPITLNWRLANVFSLSAGPQFSINTQKGESFLTTAEKAFTKGNIAIVAGANLNITRFRVSARYCWGIKDMNNIDEQDSWKQQTIQLGVGFVF
ncbi:MAG TPA: porin family protein [Phnomibacter sp.]|nr:porin family protein [Phnomibacter sp.]